MKIREMLMSVASQKIVRYSMLYIEAFKYFDRRVWDHEDGNRRIYEAVISEKPHAIGKLGSVELGALRSYLRHHSTPNAEELTAIHRKILYTNAGVFPDDYDTLQKYAKLMIREVLPEITIIAVWFNYGEAKVVKQYCQNFEPVRLGSVSSYLWQNPWTKGLAGKRVLVVHPSTDTIRQQYLNRQFIWSQRHDVLPDFELDLLKVPLSPALVPPKTSNWFETLEVLKQEMTERNFDVALIGAGAYSLPLAVHAKQLGKQGIHTGGATQVLFGIKGGRWDNSSESRFYNEYWVRPLPHEIPENAKLIENSCYW